MTRTRKPKVGNKVNALLRFATITGAESDFAPTFYTEEGNWDLVGNNAPES